MHCPSDCLLAVLLVLVIHVRIGEGRQTLMRHSAIVHSVHGLAAQAEARSDICLFDKRHTEQQKKTLTHSMQTAASLSYAEEPDVRHRVTVFSTATVDGWSGANEAVLASSTSSPSFIAAALSPSAHFVCARLIMA